MGRYTLSKRFTNFLGVDLKSTDLLRPSTHASDLLNAQYTKKGEIEKRKGYQAKAITTGGHGLFKYLRVNPDTNLLETEIVSVSDTLNKLVDASLIVTYTGADPTAVISIFLDDSSQTFKCQIIEGSSTVLDEDLKVGFDEASIVTIDDLRADIDALANFTATISGTASTPAAFLDITDSFDLTASALTVSAKDWTAVNKTVTSPFAGSETNKNSTIFENVSAVQLQNVLYLSNGYEDVQKYDGQTLYRAGVPRVGSISSSVAAGSVTGTNYFHRATVIQIDAVGNVTEGNHLAVSTGLSPTAQSMDVTIGNVLAGSGFNTNCAIVAGAQVTVNTITVDDGSGGFHTMKTGDTAFFFDSVTGDYITREVTGTAATTITVDGAAVTVADNAVISNNLRIAIYRNKTSATTPTTFFLVEEIPNDSFTSTQVFNDDTADASLGAEFILPLTSRDLPPKGKYISAWNNIAMIGGQFDKPNTLFYSDVDSPEFFPTDNALDVDSSDGFTITGISQNNEVFCAFKRRGIAIISGNITDNDIRVDHLSTDAGCISHASIKEIRGALFFLSEDGPRFMVGGQLPRPLGIAIDDNREETSRIDSLFDQSGLTTDEKLVFERSVAVDDPANEKYIVFIPAESLSGVNRYANSNSKTLVYDYSRDAWLIWNNLNMAAGAVKTDSGLFFSERRLSAFTGNVDHLAYRFLDLDSVFDYADHQNAVDRNYKSQWEFLGEPSVFKKYLAIRIFSSEAATNVGTETIEIETNFIEDFVKGSFTIDFDSLGYGESAYGEAAYGDPLETASVKKLPRGKFRSLRTIFKNSVIHENPIITGWELEIATDFQPQFKD